MKAVLICPSARSAVPLLSEAAPLALTPFLGQGLVEYWLSWLAAEGAREVLVLAHDRPEQIESVVENGARWGVEARVLTESRELTVAEARLKYGSEPGEIPIEVADHFPGLPTLPLFSGYADLFAALRHWMPFAVTPDRVAVRQVRPGIWVGSRSEISPEAQLHAPCWIGNHVFVGACAILRPGTIIEDGAFLEPGVEIGESLVGSDTFVGSLARISESLAWGQTLVNWRMNSVTTVPDPFLLCAVRQPRRRHAVGRLGRWAELYDRNKEEALLAWKQLLLHKGG